MNTTNAISWAEAKEVIGNGGRVRRADWPTEWHIGAKGDGSGDFQWHDGVTYRSSDADEAYAFAVVKGGAK